MTPRARRVAALAIVVAAFAAFRILVPDPAQRREAMLVWLVPLGYGHVLGSVWFGARRGDRMRQLVAFTAVALGGVWLVGAIPGAPLPLAVALAAVAIWHAMENEAAMGARGQAGADRAAPHRGPLPPLPRAPGGHALPTSATAAALGVALAVPWLAHPALSVGLPVALAVWTAEDVIAAVLIHHVVSWALLAARPGRIRAVVALHALPLAAGLGSAAAWPAAHAAVAAPLPYLVVSLAHALHTAWQRGVAPHPR